MEEIAIYLNNEEAELFKRFLQYHDVWEKALKIKSGSATLHFDREGNLKMVDYNHRETVEN